MAYYMVLRRRHLFENNANAYLYIFIESVSSRERRIVTNTIDSSVRKQYMNWIIVLYPKAMSNARQRIVFTPVRLTAASMQMH